MRKVHFVLPTLFAVMAFSIPVMADKMDLDTHNVVIDRLKDVVKNLDNSDSSKVPSSLRLADLLAERSRLKGLKEVEQNCDNCLKAKEDRKEAINYYAQVISKLQGEQRSQSLLQKAHLHFSLGEISQTEKIYKQITNEGSKKHSPFMLGQAHASLGDVYFQQAKFKDAKKQYEKALEISETPNRGFVYYRLSWSIFNLNQVSKAIGMLEMILQTPALTATNNGEGLAQDNSFKMDVSKDLATFYARSKVTRARIEKIQKLSPEGHAQENLFFLGTEADRLGKKSESAMVWMVYLENSGKDPNALEAQVRLAKLKRDMGQVKESLNTFRNIQGLWKRPGCGDKCADLQAQIRKWIIEWNKEEKKKQTPELTQAYVIYTEIFPEDAEMLYWGAEVAQKRNQHAQAQALYSRAADVSHELLRKGKKLSESDRKSFQTIFEGSLVGEMDMAETRKDYASRVSAYHHYLKLNPQGQREFEVRYQLAQAEFDAKHYDKAAPMFRSLALEKIDKKRKLQKSAADMSLDALIVLKNEETIEQWSADYARHFSEAHAEYALIHRKAVLNATAKRINEKRANESDLKKMHSISLVGATPQERITLYKNRYLLALQLKNFVEAKSANQGLLGTKELSRKDREEAVDNRIWLAEMELDFKTAYFYAKSQEGKLTADRALRLIWLAQMAGMSPDKHEQEFLKISKNRSLRATVITARLQRIKKPQKEFKSHLKELAQSPDVLARLSLELYSKTGDLSFLEMAHQQKSLRKSSVSGVVARLLQYKDLNKQIASATYHKLNTRSDKGLQKSLAQRMDLLKGLEKSAQRAISSKDVILQTILLNTLRRENDRLYAEVLKLPVPRGLKPAQREQYLNLLAQQADPYRVRSVQLTESLNKIWSDGRLADQLSKSYTEARREYKPALRKDLEQLMNHVPQTYRQQFAKTLSTPDQIPSEKAVHQLRKLVQKNPFEKTYVSELKDLESRRGNDLVVAHLEARLNQMKGVLK